jgi:hypothetical protein
MAIRIRKTGTVTAQFASAQQVDISHLNDSVNIGDGTNLFGPLQNVGGTLCFPIKIMASAISGGDASASNQTSGAQKTQIVDDTGLNTVDATLVGGNYALKVDVVSSVGGSAAPAFTDDAAFTVAVSSGTPAGGTYKSTVDTVDDGDFGVFHMTQRRGLHVSLRKESDASEMIGQKAMAASIPVALASDQAAIPVTKSGTWDITNAGTFAVQETNVVVDNAGFTDGATKLQMAGFIFDEVAGTALTENDAAAGRVNANRAQVFTLEDGATRARYATVSAANALKVDGSAVNQPVTQAVADWTQNITKLAGTAVSVNSGVKDAGTLRVVIATDQVNLTTPWNDNVAQINGVTPLMGAGNGGTGSLRVNIASDQVAIATTPAGNVAHDGADSGNPIKVGFKALDSKPTAVAAADRTDAYATLDGRLLTDRCPAGNFIYQQTTITSSVAETTIVTAVASKHRDLLGLVVTNSSATALIVTLKDSTGGTTRAIYAIAANGGIVIPFTMYQLAAVNNNWTLTCGTSVASVYVVATFMERD